MKQEWLDILGIQSEAELDKVNWNDVSQDNKLTEDFIEKYSDKVNWDNISIFQILSEAFIEKHSDKVNWDWISQYQLLSEDFIEKHSDKVNWYFISKIQQLSEDFIEKYYDQVDWYWIFKCQKLSEDFIEKYFGCLYWDNIFQYQQLTESFIENYSDKVNWEYIEKYQKYQKLSPDFMKKHNISKPEHNWLYATKEEKMQAIRDCGEYEIDGDYVIAYKATRKNGLSCYNSQYVYQVGNVYESNCDCNLDEPNSFGLSAWTKEKALDYYPHGELYKVKIHINNIGALVQDSKKLRCFKFEVIERIK